MSLISTVGVRLNTTTPLSLRVQQAVQRGGNLVRTGRSDPTGVFRAVVVQEYVSRYTSYVVGLGEVSGSVVNIWESQAV